MDGTNAHLRVGKVSLPGHPHSRVPQTLLCPLSHPCFAANNARGLARKTTLGLATAGSGLSAQQDVLSST